MKNKVVLIVAWLGLSAILATGQVVKKFPAHWGSPPAIQTQDYGPLPDGYGHGSSTLAKWIAMNLERDRHRAPASTPLYANNFETEEAGKLPPGWMALAGEFVVRRDGTNQFLELPGAPLDSFAALFGPATGADTVVSARVLGMAKGRRFPTFGVGLGGVAGYKLHVAPGKKSLELIKDQEVKASVAFDWHPGLWTQLRLQVRSVKAGGWKIEGKAWPQDGAEPAEWTITFDEKEEPATGRASVLGSPFAGTPIWFDELLVEKAATK